MGVAARGRKKEVTERVPHRRPRAWSGTVCGWYGDGAGAVTELPGVTACAQWAPDWTARRSPGCGLGGDWPRAG